MGDQDDWSCDANDALQITLIQPGEQKPTTLSTFHPTFTYPIFGDEERIFGYKGLIIRLRFAAHDLRSHVHISYDEKFKAVGDTAATDLNKTLKEWIPESAFSDLPAYERAIQHDEVTKDFVPPGKLVQSYITNGRNYEIWAGSLADEKVKTLLERAQIFVPLFIEAGTPLVTDDPDWTLERWTVYFVYEKIIPPTPAASEFSIVGYATTYRWWFYPKQETKTVSEYPYKGEVRFSELPSRLRIAQFLIFPPHQGTGHGVHLYTTIHSASVADPTIVELTVEDPNEAFDALRDMADYRILRPEFLRRNVNIDPNPYPENEKASKRRPRLVPTGALIPTETLQQIRAQYKIAPTQFAHILEMFLLSRIPLKYRAKGGALLARLLVKKHKVEDEHERRYYWWRMLVKQRLYKRSRDVLIQLDPDERIKKLDETLLNVEEGYENLLTVVEEREELLKGRQEKEDNGGVGPKEATIAEGNVANGTPARDRTKRKYRVIADDDDEDEEESLSEAAKKPKI